jgi:hypothetical protein
MNRREGKTMGRDFKISILKSTWVRDLFTPLGISEFQRWGSNLKSKGTSTNDAFGGV